MKFPLAAILIAALSATAAFAQTPAKPAARPAAAKKAPSASQRLAIEEATPTEEPDPKLTLSEGDLAVARRVHVGDIQCELGAKVFIKAMKREGFFFVTRGINRFVMHPVESRTGAIRLEDAVRGAVWIQLGNKSMLMNQKEGKRLADECQSAEQVQFAAEMKTRPLINLLEPPPKPVAPTVATQTAPAAPTTAAGEVGSPGVASPANTQPPPAGGPK